MEIHERKVTVVQNAQATEVTLDLTTIESETSKKTNSVSVILQTDQRIADAVEQFLQLMQSFSTSSVATQVQDEEAVNRANASLDDNDKED